MFIILGVAVCLVPLVCLLVKETEIVNKVRDAEEPYTYPVKDSFEGNLRRAKKFVENLDVSAHQKAKNIPFVKIYGVGLDKNNTY
ncbi:hypothetical protein BH09PAT1_BH09PAT1_6570 [soil metagenome]